MKFPGLMNPAASALPSMLQPLAPALAVKTMSNLNRAAVTAVASLLWSLECSNRMDNDPTILLPLPSLLPLASAQGRESNEHTFLNNFH